MLNFAFIAKFGIFSKIRVPNLAFFAKFGIEIWQILNFGFGEKFQILQNYQIWHRKFGKKCQIRQLIFYSVDIVIIKKTIILRIPLEFQVYKTAF